MTGRNYFSCSTFSRNLTHVDTKKKVCSAKVAECRRAGVCLRGWTVGQLEGVCVAAMLDTTGETWG